jgi:hypothetical protein
MLGDLNRTAEEGKKKLLANDRRSLYATDYIQLIEEASLRGSDNLLELIAKVYALGYEQGYRARRSEEKRRSNNRRATV